MINIEEKNLEKEVAYLKLNKIHINITPLMMELNKKLVDKQGEKSNKIMELIKNYQKLKRAKKNKK